MASKEKMLENYLRLRRAEINNYENARNAFISLKKYFEEQFAAKVYFGGTIKGYSESEKQKSKTPDIIIEFPDVLDIGDIKKSVRDKREAEEWTAYQDYLKEKCITPLVDCKKILEQNKTKVGTIYLLMPTRLGKAVSNLKNKILDPVENIVLLSYSIEPLANTMQVTIQKQTGKITEEKVEQALTLDSINMKFGDIAELRSKYKIYEENHLTPFEYYLIIIWQEVFPEALKLGTKEAILRRYESKEEAFDYQVTLNELANVLAGFTLPCWKNERSQFTKNILQQVMDVLSRMLTDRVKKIPSQVENPTYLINYAPLPEKDVQNYLLSKYFSTLSDKQQRAYLTESGIEKLEEY